MRRNLLWPVLAAVLAFGAAARADDAKQPPDFVRSIFASVPPSITRVASAASGARVLLFYDEGSMFDPAGASDGSASRKSFIQIWNGSAWDEPRPFSHVSEALNVGGEFWALTDGGYMTSTDGAAWSPLISQPDWKNPFGCVLEGRPHVFSIDGSELRETAFDGKRWSVPHLIPGDWKGGMNGFPFGSGMQAAVVSGRIHLFRIKGDKQRMALLDMDDDDVGVGSPRVVGPAESFRLLEAPDGLHLFYRDLTAPPQLSTPSISNVFAMMGEMQARAARTSHRVYDGRAWSEPEAILTGQAMTLAAARTDDALWLFTSAMSVVVQTVRRGGAWSPPKAVPGTNAMAASSSKPFYAAMAGIWLLFAVPMMLMIGLIIWGVSALVESNNPVALELAGGRVRCASLLRRAGAQFADGFVLWLVEMAIFIPFSLGGFSDPTAMMTKMADHFFAIWSTMMLTMLALYFAYFAVCEAKWGRTPGKRLLGIRVIADDGAPCSPRASAIRNVLRMVDVMPYYLIGAAAFAFGKKHQRVGDMAAHTLVVLDAQPS